MEVYELASELGLKRNGREFHGSCPSCDYPTGFSLAEKDGRLLFYCHAGGCSFDEIRSTLVNLGLWKFGETHMTDYKKTRILTGAQLQMEFAKDRAASAARMIWISSQSPEGTPAELYLRRRGYKGRIPNSIRFTMNGYHKPTGSTHPMMVCLVKRPGSDEIAIHRTYLTWDGKKAPFGSSCKMMLGPISGGSCQLAEAGPILLVSEGLENALTVYQATGLPTWSALSAAGFKKLILPPLPLAEKVVICADPDKVGIEKARMAAERWHGEGRKVVIAKPSRIGSDFNDLLLKGVEHE